MLHDVAHPGRGDSFGATWLRPTAVTNPRHQQWAATTPHEKGLTMRSSKRRALLTSSFPVTAREKFWAPEHQL